MNAFGIFEGGGVRGYAHLGALKACEDRGIELCGIAGTSIGAIVAVLVAVGYKSTELYALDEKGKETGLFAGDVVKEFFEAREYNRLKRLRGWWSAFSAAFDLERGPMRLVARTRVGSACGKLWLLRRKALLGSLEVAVAAAPVHSLAAFLFALPHWRLLRAVWARSGVLDGDRFAKWLNERLCERSGLPAGTIITFADIDMPLSLIAANLSGRRMTMFDRASHPNLSVADAAMASAAYPIVFKPRLVADEIFVDGGLVSNFPAWALDAARAQQDDIMPTFGFRVVDAPAEQSKIWPGSEHPQLIEVAQRIFAAASSGRGDLESRRIDDLHPICVETKIKATDFHLILQERAGLYNQGRQCVHDYFASQLGPQDPRSMQDRLRRVKDLVREMTRARGRIRAYLIQPTDKLFARVVYAALYEDDADDALILRRDSISQALCLARREPILMRVTDLDDRQRRSPATKYIHALRPQCVTHVYSIPMFHKADEWSKTDPEARSEPVAALCFDFENADDRLLLEVHVEDALAALADAFVGLWKDQDYDGLPVLPSEEDQPPSGDWSEMPGATGYYVSSRNVRKRPLPALQAQLEKLTA